jgi:hypothetical protein
MFPMDRRAVSTIPVTVEYTGPSGKRVTRTLPNAVAARRFYAAALAKGQAPRVVGAKL